MDGYLLALIIFLAYIAILIIGAKTKFWDKLHISLYGPLMLLKTKKGRNFLDRLSRYRRFWYAYGKTSIFVCLFAMVFLTAILIWEAFLVLKIPASEAPSPELMLGLPGINPVIPLWYGILGIAVGIVVHEVAHGITSRASKIKVESMGLVFLIFPVGAFVEPNEDELKETSSRNRLRIYASGPATNIFIAIICILLLSLVIAPSAQPITAGAVVISSATDSPADRFGLDSWAEIVSINGHEITSASDLDHLRFSQPGAPASVRVFYAGQYHDLEIPIGVVATGVVSGLPAYNSGIRPGMIIYSINGTVITGLDMFRSVVENETPYVPLDIVVLSPGFNASMGREWFEVNRSVTNITLTTKWDYYYANFPSENKPEYRKISYMGITCSIFGVYSVDTDFVTKLYTNPLGRVTGPGDAFMGFMKLIALPFLGYTPVGSPMADLYAPSGVFSFLGNDGYWITVNCFYWVFWINLMLGLTNALPAVPLDGGFVLKDLIKEAFIRGKRRKIGLNGMLSDRPGLTEEQLDKIVGSIVIAASLIILFLILWQLIGPRLGL